MRIVVKAKVQETIENEVEFEINAGTGGEYEEYLALRAAGDTAGIKRLLEEGVEAYHTSNRFEAAESDLDIWSMTYEEFDDDDNHTADTAEGQPGPVDEDPPAGGADPGE